MAEPDRGSRRTDRRETGAKHVLRTVTAMTYRAKLRIELPDRPGALGRAAGVIGSCGGNVISVDVQEVDGDLAVDEIVVDLPDSMTPDGLRQALASERAGTLLSHQAPRPYDDPVLRALHWAGALAEVDEQDRGDELARAIADLCSASGAWVSTTSEARRHEAGRFALERGAPVAQRTTDLPTWAVPDSPRGAWLLAVPDDGMAATRVAFLARPAGLRFTTTEISRVVALLRVARRLDATCGDAVPHGRHVPRPQMLTVT
jgi:hypothetical protein